MFKERTNNITINTGVYWGLICIIPFGWIFFLASIIRHKNDVIKYKTLDARLALIVLHNYIVSYIIIFIIAMIICIEAWVKGYFIMPNLIAVLAILITYRVATNKIINYKDKAKTKKR